MPRRTNLTFPTAVDPPLQQPPGDKFDPGARASVDDQIRAIETYLLALPTGGSTTLAGDVTGPSGTNVVANITGNGTTATCSMINLQWIAGATTPTIGQATKTSDQATQNITIQSQAPWASAATNKSPGNVVIAVPAPVGGGAAGLVQFKISGSVVGSVDSTGLVSATALSLGTTTAAAGTIRLASAATTLVAVRNAGNSADIAVAANNANALTFGDTTSGATATFTSGSADCKLQTATGTYVQLANASGNVFISSTDVQISNNLGLGVGIELTPTYNGAAKVQFGALVTSATVAVADTAVNSATGITTTYGGQNATGTTSIGGDTVVSCGTGTTRYGNVKITGPLAPGRFAQAMADANQTISVANSAANIIETTGALTATRTLTISRAPTNSSMVFINNKCTGGFGLSVQFLTGSTFSIASGKSAIVYGDGTNATGFTITT